jgi:mitochondrial import inner membrane translocase subunit TIM50
MAQQAKVAQNESGAAVESAVAEEPVLSTGQKSMLGSLLVMMGVILGVSNEVTTKPDSAITQAYRGSSMENFVDWLRNNTVDRFNNVFQPFNDEQIPRFESGPIYGDIPPWADAPPLLVLDVEKTLVGSTYDTKYGWRHIKRPGVKKFLDNVTKHGYYEVALFSENYDCDEIFMALDPEGRCHKLSGHDAEERDNLRLKRLDLMNRDLGRIILVDDDPASSQLFPRNTLLIRPFDDPTDTTDTALSELLLLLQGLQHDGVKDFRDAFDNLGTHEVEEAVTEYKIRVAEARSKEKAMRNKGLGSLVRGKQSVRDNDSYFEDDRQSLLGRVMGGAGGGAGQSAAESNSSSLTDFAGVGAGAITGTGSGSDQESARKKAEKRKGAMFQWMDDLSKESAEQKQARNQKMNERFAELEQKKREKADAKKKQMEADA